MARRRQRSRTNRYASRRKRRRQAGIPLRGRSNRPSGRATRAPQDDAHRPRHPEVLSAAKRRKAPKDEQHNQGASMRKSFLAAASAAALTAGMSVASAQDLSQPLPFTLKTKPSTTGGASVNVPPGSAPASPNNGDLWTTLTGLWARINGATVPIVSGP